MTTYSFEAPFILRLNKMTMQDIGDEGFFVCEYGCVLFDTETRILKIIDQDDNEEKLTMSLTQVTLIECRPFKSKGGNFKGGKVCLHGVFDRGVEEKITIKMNTGTFRHFGQVLKQALEASI